MGSYMPTVPSPSSPSSPSTLPPPPPPARHDQDPAFTHGWARRNSYRTFKTIGAGSEGRVKAAVHLASGRGVALKIHTKPVEPVLSRGLKASTSFEKAVRDCRNYVPELRRKFEAVRGLDHPGVLRQIEMFEVQDKVYIASELCAGVSLMLPLFMF